MTELLEGKTALVTGAAGGIGTAVCRELLSAGSRVAAVDLPGQPAPEGTVGIECDLAEPSGVEHLFREFQARFDRLDVLIHCAGIARDGVVWKLKDEDWERVLQVNLDSAFRLVRAGVPLMRDAGGTIVLVSSINGERGKFGQSNYAASKAGLIGFGRSVARETGRFGIRVNVVAPGMIETAMTAGLPEAARRQAVDETALGRIGRPEDVARAVLFLASAMSDHVTGQVLRVDGGQLIG